MVPMSSPLSPMSNSGQIRWLEECRLTGNLTEQLDRDLVKCRCFSIQRNKSVASSSTSQLMMFIPMVFDDFSAKDQLLTLLPLKTTMRGVDIYNAVKRFFVEKKVSLDKLVSVTTDGAPAMTGQNSGFIVLYAEATQTSQNFDITTASFTSRRCVEK